MKKFMMAAFLGLFFLGARPVSADVVIGVPVWWSSTITAITTTTAIGTTTTTMAGRC